MFLSPDSSHVLFPVSHELKVWCLHKSITSKTTRSILQRSASIPLIGHIAHLESCFIEEEVLRSGDRMKKAFRISGNTEPKMAKKGFDLVYRAGKTGSQAHAPSVATQSPTQCVMAITMMAIRRCSPTIFHGRSP